MITTKLQRDPSTIQLSGKNVVDKSPKSHRDRDQHQFSNRQWMETRHANSIQLPHNYAYKLAFPGCTRAINIWIPPGIIVSFESEISSSCLGGDSSFLDTATLTLMMTLMNKQTRQQQVFGPLPPYIYHSATTWPLDDFCQRQMKVFATRRLRCWSWCQWRWRWWSWWKGGETRLEVNCGCHSSLFITTHTSKVSMKEGKKKVNPLEWLTESSRHFSPHTPTDLSGESHASGCRFRAQARPKINCQLSAFDNRIRFARKR